MSANFEYLNYLASKSKETCDPTKNLRSSPQEIIARRNNETYKANNGQYPHRLYQPRY